MKPGDIVVYRVPAPEVLPEEPHSPNGTLGWGLVKRLSTVTDRDPRTGEPGYQVDGLWIGLLPATPEIEHFIPEDQVVAVFAASEVRQSDYLAAELAHVKESRDLLGWTEARRK